MQQIQFVKMQGAGNDFVFLNKESLKSPMTKKLAQRLLDRHFGVGGDQLLVLSKQSSGYPYKLDIYNADGSQAEMCGNGVRAVARYLVQKKKLSRNFVILTKAGPIGIGLDKGHISVDMGEPILEGSRIPVRAEGPIIDRVLKVGGKTYRIHGVSMGNPHCVVYVSDVNRFPVREVGPQIENHSFFPKRVNVEFVQVLSRNHVRARVWERGSGETLACGTGACAIAVASARARKTERKIKIDLPGGQLSVEWAARNNRVFLSGPSEVSFTGTFSLKNQ